MTIKTLLSLKPDLSSLTAENIGFGLSIVIFTVLLLSMSEGFNHKNLRAVYDHHYGFGYWRGIFISSVMGGLGFGAIGFFAGSLWVDGYLMFYLANFCAVLGYVGIQSYYTDIEFHLVDRYLLRIAYLDTLAITATFLLRNYGHSLELLFTMSITVLVIYLVLIIAFFASSIGSSDVRAFAVFLPFYAAVNAPVAVISLVLVTVYVTTHMSIKKKRQKDKWLFVPIIPHLLIPYAVITPFLGFILDAWRTYSLMK